MYEKIFRRSAFHPERITEQEARNLVKYSALDWEKVALDASDGMRVYAYLYSREGHTRVVVFLHGNAGNAEERIAYVDKLALQTSSDVVLLSYRGYGLNTGEPTENGLYADGKAAYDFVQGNPLFKGKNIFLYGESIGSAVAVDLLQKTSVSGVILIAPFNSGYEWAKAHGFPSIFLNKTVNRFNSLVKISHLTTSPPPLLIMHGCEDLVTPMVLSKDLYEKWPNESKYYVEFCPGGHNDLISLYGRKFWHIAGEFMQKPTSMGRYSKRCHRITNTDTE